LEKGKWKKEKGKGESGTRQVRNLQAQLTSRATGWRAPDLPLFHFPFPFFPYLPQGIKKPKSNTQ
jgi:hypothetical protein